jgi:hypothetical protein
MVRVLLGLFLDLQMATILLCDHILSSYTQGVCGRGEGVEQALWCLFLHISAPFSGPYPHDLMYLEVPSPNTTPPWDLCIQHMNLGGTHANPWQMGNLDSIL